MNAVGSAGTLLLLFVTAAACATADIAGTSDDTTPLSEQPTEASVVQTRSTVSTPSSVADGTVIAGVPSATMPEALVPGTVVLESGCVRLRIEFLGTVVAVWPPGSLWDPESESVVLEDGRRIGVGDHVEGGGGYYSAETIGEMMPTILDAVVACLPDGVDAATADQVVLTYPERVIDGTGPGSSEPAALASSSSGAALETAIVIVIAAEPDDSASCLPSPVVELVSAAGRLTMDLVSYSEHAPPCGLDVDGAAVFDDEFRPAVALAAPDGELTLVTDQFGAVTVDVRSLSPGDRLAAITVEGDPLTAVSDGTYLLAVPTSGCSIVTVSWQGNQRGGVYTALAEGPDGRCETE